MMRKVSGIAVFLFILFITNNLSAQQYQIKEGTYSMSKGTQPGFEIVLPGVDEKVAREEIKKWMNQFKGKTGTKKGEIYSDNAIIPEISDHPVDIYAVVKKTKDGSVVYVFFDLGGAFLNPNDHKDKFNIAKRMLDKLGKNLVRADLEAKIKEVEKDIKNAEKELNALKKQQEKLENKIKECEKTIKESKEELKETTKQQEEVTKQLQRKQQHLKELQEKLKNIK
ncbi:MAG: hypothetical protein GXO48_04285 [Chlorobi bacterium]|nr:hypothetical protein [Chlorobiota bacterium]